MASAGELAVRESQALSADLSATHLTGPQLKYIANTNFVPKDYRGKLPEIMACVAYGRALGIADMEALNEIYLIDGSPSYSAHLMSRLARERGHSIRIKTRTDEECTLVGRRADNGDEIPVTWTITKAEKQGLASKPNWKKMPEQMLFARAMSQLCRELFSDCFGGSAPYTPDELRDSLPEASDDGGAGVSGDDEAPADAAEIVDQTDDPQPVTQEQKDRLRELFNEIAAQDQDRNLGTEATEKLKKDYGVDSYNDLSRVQMDDLLRWLGEQAA